MFVVVFFFSTKKYAHLTKSVRYIKKTALFLHHKMLLYQFDIYFNTKRKEKTKTFLNDLLLFFTGVHMAAYCMAFTAY